MEQFSTPRAPLAPRGSSDHPSQPPPYGRGTKRKLEENDFQYEFDPSELRFPGDAGDSKGQSVAWLVKLPPYLTKHWKEILDMEDNEEIVLGAIRVKVPKAAGDKQQIHLRLNPNLKSSQNILQDYSLESRGKPHNMYCWSEQEKNVPEKQTGPPIPVAFIEKSHKRHRGAGTIPGSKETTFRHPSKVNRTSFVAKFHDDLVATPIRTEGTSILCARPQVVKKEPEYTAPVNAQMNLLRPGTIGKFPNKKEKELLFTAAAPKPIYRRNVKDRAYRMDKDSLLSNLYKLFERKESWCLKELREQLFQPEAYLKQVLREIAIYNPDRSMIGAWVLNPDSKEALKWMRQKNEN